MAIPISRYVDGYPSLAALVASDRDGSTAIFKRFNRLAARNLLTLQSELVELQMKLDSFDAEDQHSDSTMQSLRNWEDYKARERDNSSRMSLIRQIRGTMKEYREALLAESQLAAIPSPQKATVKAFRFAFFHGKPGSYGSFPTLGGNSAALYDDADDLVALRHAQHCDRMTQFMWTHFGYLFKDKTKENSGFNSAYIDYISAQKMETFVSYVSTILAAFLLVGAILALHSVTSDSVKLGLLSLFTIVFAASVGLLTKAKRSEVFGATAAYAAVLVVFVSGELGGS